MNIMTGRWVGLLAALALLTPVGAAHADSEQIGLSSDGASFGAQPALPLFGADIAWVPGDVREATLYIRNQGSSAADLTLDLLGEQPGDLLATGAISITASTPGGPTSDVVTDDAGHRLVAMDGVADGDVVPVTIRTAYDPGSSNATQDLFGDMVFLVSLTETVDSGSADSGVGSHRVFVSLTGDEGSGAGDLNALLPGTGADAQRLAPLAALAFLLLTGGALLIRRHNDDDKGASHG